ncbi:MAG: class I SAM-dependent methyltransferase [Thermoleophilaceae bacterium]
MGYLSRVFHASEEANRRAILRTLPSGRGGALLDLGTHRGGFTTRVADRLGAERVAGVELIERHAAVAQRRGVDVTVGDLDEGLPFRSESFDVVHANQVLEHVRRTDVFMREVRRVLKPDGLACISTNNLSSWHNVLSLGLGMQPMPMHVSDEIIVGNPLNPENRWGHRDAGRTHLRLFTARALSELAGYHGLALERLETVGYYPLPPLPARAAARLDRLHAAFLIGLFRPVARENVVLHVPREEAAAELWREA